MELKIGDFDAAAEVLSRAFCEDPAFHYMLPDPESRLGKIKWLMKRWIRLMAPRGLATFADGGKGVLIAIPPEGDPNISLLALVRRGLLLAPFVLGLRGASRLLAIHADIQQRHDQDLAEPHWVVDIVGVHPDAQGGGVGHALLTSVIKRATAAQRSIYLVTHNPRSVDFYKRIGFEILSEARVAKDGPTAWSLRRRADRC